jgi:hypothetical protein
VRVAGKLTDRGSYAMGSLRSGLVHAFSHAGFPDSIRTVLLGHTRAVGEGRPLGFWIMQSGLRTTNTGRVTDGNINRRSPIFIMDAGSVDNELQPYSRTLLVTIQEQLQVSNFFAYPGPFIN